MRRKVARLLTLRPQPVHDTLLVVEVEHPAVVHFSTDLIRGQAFSRANAISIHFFVAVDVEKRIFIACVLQSF